MKPTKQIKAHLEHLRSELRAERISYGDLAELQSLAEYIEPGDVELLEAAGVPEFHEYPDEICIKWSVDDFEGRAIDRESFMDTEFEPDEDGDAKPTPIYDRTKFTYGLFEMGRLHDCNNGITWDTVDYYLDEYCKL